MFENRVSAHCTFSTPELKKKTKSSRVENAHCSERNSAAARKGRDGDKAEHTVVGSEVVVLVGGTTDMTYDVI